MVVSFNYPGYGHYIPYDTYGGIGLVDVLDRDLV